MEVNQVRNLLLANAPPNLQAQAGEAGIQQASAPSAPYTSKVAGLLKALEGGLGGLMEGSAIRQAMDGRQAAMATGYGLLNSLQPGGGAGQGAPAAAPSTAPGGSTASNGGGIGSDHVATKQAGDHAAWIASIMPDAQRISAQTGIDARIIAAQAAHESNYGRSAPGGNLFGIKGPGSGPISTMESVNGQMVPTKASFASYDSPSASFDGYGKLMSGPRYAGVRNGQGLDAQLAALGTSGYATDPNYAAKVGAIARGITLPGAGSGSGAPVTTAASPLIPGTTIGDTAAMAAQNRLTSGRGTDADRALLTAYRQQQNTPAAPRTAAADVSAPGSSAGTLAGNQGGDTLGASPASDGTVRGDLMAAVAQHGGLDPDAPAPNATPTGMAGLPPGVTPAMWAASQNTATDGNALRRGDEMPAGAPPGGTVTASGVPHQLAPGASARADSGVATSVSSGPSDTASGVLQPQPDPEAARAQNPDPNAEPSLRDTLEAAFKGPDLGKVQPVLVPAPAPLGPGDQVGPGGMVTQPAGPSPLSGSMSGQGAMAGAQPNAITPAPLAPGDTVGADGTVTPASDGSVRGDLLAAAAQHGMDVSGAPVMPPPQGDLTAPPPAPAPDPIAAGQMAGRDVALDPVVPDPQGAGVPPAPSSPNDALEGPQSDAAAGNGGDDLRAMLTAQVMGSGAGTAGPQSDAAMGGGTLGGAGGPAAPQAGPQAGSPAGLPAPAPLPPPGAQKLQAATDAASAAAPTVDPNAVGLPATEPTLRDHLEAAFNGTPLPGGAPTSGPGVAPNRMAGADVGDTGLDAMRAGMVGQQPDGAPAAGVAAVMPSTPSVGSTALAAMAGPGVPPPSPMPGQGGAPSSSDLSKLAVGPLTLGYMSGLANALTAPAQPATAPHPMALAAALDGSKPAPGAVPAGPAPARLVFRDDRREDVVPGMRPPETVLEVAIGQRLARAALLVLVVAPLLRDLRVPLLGRLEDVDHHPVRARHVLDVRIERLDELALGHREVGRRHAAVLGADARHGHLARQLVGDGVVHGLVRIDAEGGETLRRDARLARDGGRGAHLTRERAGPRLVEHVADQVEPGDLHGRGVRGVEHVVLPPGRGLPGLLRLLRLALPLRPRHAEVGLAVRGDVGGSPVRDAVLL